MSAGKSAHSRSADAARSVCAGLATDTAAKGVSVRSTRTNSAMKTVAKCGTSVPPIGSTEYRPARPVSGQRTPKRRRAPSDAFRW